MANNNGSNGINGGKFNQWMSNGLLTTVAWTALLIIYCVFRALKIEDPFIGNAFQLFTGAWIAHLTLVQGKKQTSMQEKQVVTEERVDRLTEAAKKNHPEITDEL